MESELDARDEQAERIVRDVGIPPCPAMLTRLVREMRAEDPDFRRVSKLIASDVALAAAVLSVANSPYYGLRSKAASLQQAAVLLGLDAVSQLVTGLLLRQVFPTAAGPEIERYWKCSRFSALIAALIAGRTGAADGATAHTYTLFQNCGMAVMLKRFANYRDILDGSAMSQGSSITALEESRYATNHARIGACLAASWHLPDAVCGAILHHHDVLASAEARHRAAPQSAALIAAALAAEQIFCFLNDETNADWDHAGAWALARLRLPPEAYDALAAEIRASAGMD